MNLFSMAFIAFIAILAIICIFASLNNKAVILAVVFPMMLLLLLIAIFMPFAFEEPQAEYVDTKELVALNDVSSANGYISGRLFAVSGSIGEEDVYKYIYKIDNTTLKQSRIPCESTTIHIISEEEQPRIETYTESRYGRNAFDMMFLIKSKEIYRLYIPRNAIANDVVIDLK